MPPDNSPLRLLCLEYCDFVNSTIFDPYDLAVTRHTRHDRDLGRDAGRTCLSWESPFERESRDLVLPFTLNFCVIAFRRYVRVKVGLVDHMTVTRVISHCISFKRDCDLPALASIRIWQMSREISLTLEGIHPCEVADGTFQRIFQCFHGVKGCRFAFNARFLLGVKESFHFIA